MSFIYKSEVIDIYPYPSLNPNEEGTRRGEWEESQRNVSRGSSRRGGKALTQSVWLMTTIKVGKRGREEKKTETVMQGTWGWSKVMNIIIREKEKKKNAGLQIRPKRVVGSVFIPRWSWKPWLFWNEKLRWIIGIMPVWYWLVIRSDTLCPVCWWC